MYYHIPIPTTFEKVEYICLTGFYKAEYRNPQGGSAAVHFKVELARQGNLLYLFHVIDFIIIMIIQKFYVHLNQITLRLNRSHKLVISSVQSQEK